VFLSEIADDLEAPRHRLALHVAHDGSIVRLAAALEIFPLRWPRLGSEIVIEVCATSSLDLAARQLICGLRFSDLAG
jgi:hypothetical protein